MALCEPCLYFIFEAKAVENTTASQAGLITAMLPILVMVAAAIFLKERIGARSWLGATVAVGGVCWLTLLSRPSADGPQSAAWQFSRIFSDALRHRLYHCHEESDRTLFAHFFSPPSRPSPAVFFICRCFGLPSTELPDKLSTWDPGLAVLYLGAVITLGAYGLYNYGLKQVPANKAASFVNLIPIFSVFLGWLLLGETLTSGQTAAGVMASL